LEHYLPLREHRLFPSVRVTGFNGQELPTWPRHDSTKAKLEAAVIDRDGDLGAQLSALAPTVVVDVSGPFQAYGARVIGSSLKYEFGLSLPPGIVAQVTAHRTGAPRSAIRPSTSIGPV
jgi:hypothetical protein